MTAKENVYQVLNYKEPSYIPLGTYAIDYDTVEKILGHETYVRNKVKIQIALWEGRRDEVCQSLKEDSVELFKKLDCIDVIVPHKEAIILPPEDAPPSNVTKISDDIWRSADGLVYKCSELTNDVTLIEDNREHNIGNFKGEPTAVPPDESVFEAYDYLIDALKDERFIAGLCGGFNALLLPGGMERGLVEYYLNPDSILKAQKYLLSLHSQQDIYWIRGGVDEIFVEDDFGTTRATIMSPDMMDEFVFPFMKERIKNIKKHKNKVIMHCCGNTWEILDRIIDSGVDCYQSLQTGTGMELTQLKNSYDNKLSFWGGVSVEKLIAGTSDEVREDVRNAITNNAKNGGFILGPSHSIAFGTKYDNFMAMLDEHDKLKYLH